MRVTVLMLAGSITFATPAAAQVMIDVPTWSNGILGQQAMQSTFDNYNEKNGISDAKKPVTRSANCSADALPAADRRRMEAEYVRRAKADGKASADAWVREQGMRFHRKLVAEGTCPGASPRTRTASKTDQETDDKGCRMVMKPVGGLGGAPMTMGMVPDCD